MNILLYIILFLCVVEVGISCFYIVALKKSNEQSDKNMRELVSWFERLTFGISKNYLYLEHNEEIMKENQKVIEERFSELKEGLASLQNEKQELKKRVQFTPYTCFYPNGTTIYDDADNECGHLPNNSFVTIVFEENNKGELLSGEGYVDVSIGIKNPVKRSKPFPAKTTIVCELKNGPSMGFKTLGTLRENSNIEIEEIIGNWARINTGHEQGYILLNSFRSQG